MIEIKQLSSHVDLQSGVNRYSMVVGPVGEATGLEIELDSMTYVQLGEAAKQILGGVAPLHATAQTVAEEATQHLQQERSPATMSEQEARLEAQLREMERQSAGSAPPPDEVQVPENPEDLLASVGWFRDGESSVEGPADALVDLEDEIEDPGELEAYPEDDGVEAV